MLRLFRTDSERILYCSIINRAGQPYVITYRLTKEAGMAKGEQKGNRESKKPKKDKIKTIAAAPSQKGAAAGWQPTFGSGKKK